MLAPGRACHGTPARNERQHNNEQDRVLADRREIAPGSPEKSHARIRVNQGMWRLTAARSWLSQAA